MPQRRIPVADLELIFNQTHPMWEEMRNQSIFITGGTGFFGSWLLESLLYINLHLDLNMHATVLTRDPVAFAKRSPHVATSSSVTLIKGDIRSFPSPSGRFAYVIHAAAEVVSATELPIERYEAMVDGTMRVLQFAADHGTEKFLLTSSGAVYGKQGAHLSHITEEYSGAPDVLKASAVYGEGKRAAELMCALHAERSDIKFKIARCFAFAGPTLPVDGNFAIGNFIRDAMRGGPIRIEGDGTSVRSYLYAADLAIWLWTLLFKAPSMLAFNVGSEEAISIRDLAGVVAETLNPKIQIDVTKNSDKGSTSSRYVPSTERAQRMLHLRQTVGLSESIRKMAAWYDLQED